MHSEVNGADIKWAELGKSINKIEAAKANAFVEKVHREQMYWKYIISNKGKEALTEVEAFLKREPDNYVAIVDKAFLLDGTHYVSAGYEPIVDSRVTVLYERALQLNRNFFSIYAGLSGLTSDEEFATKMADIVQKLNPNDPDSAMWRAQRNIVHRTHLDTVAADLELALQSEVPAIRNRAAEEFIRLSELQDREKNLQRAKLELDKLQKEFPDFSWVYRRLGMWATWSNDYPLAEKYLRKYQQLEPKSSEGYAEMGHLHYLKGEYLECIQAAKKEIELSRETQINIGQLAYCQAMAGQLPEAKASIGKWRQLGVNEKQMTAAYFIYAQKLNRPKEFMDWLEETHRAKKLGDWAYEEWSCMVATEWTETASSREDLNMKCARAIKNPQIGIGRRFELEARWAWSLCKVIGDLAQCKIHMENVLRFPEWVTNQGINSSIDEVAAILGQTDQFYENLESYVAKNPKNLHIRVSLAFSRAYRGHNVARAEELLKGISESQIDPIDSDDYFHAKAYIAKSKGKESEASDYAKRAYDKSPTANNLSAYTYFLTNNKSSRSEVVKLAEKQGANALESSDAIYLYNVAVSYADQKQCDKAKPYAEKAASLVKSNSEEGYALLDFLLKCGWNSLKFKQEEKTGKKK
jgi:tetratricopeptide (TPR) repeat protein